MVVRKWWADERDRAPAVELQPNGLDPRGRRLSRRLGRGFRVGTGDQTGSQLRENCSRAGHVACSVGQPIGNNGCHHPGTLGTLVVAGPRSVVNKSSCPVLIISDLSAL